MVKKNFSNLSYPSICTIIRKGQIKVNKKQAKNSLVLNLGDKIRLYKIIKQEEKVKKVVPRFSEEIKKWVIFKDNNLIALNKPSGVAVQGGSKVKINIDALLDSLKYDQTNRPKLVHRIDKRTSGLLLIARNLKAANFLGKLFRERKIKKIFINC